MTVNLPDSIISQTDFSAALLEIRAYAKWASQAVVKQKVKAGKPGAAPDISPAAAQLINDWAGGKPLHMTELDKLIEELAEFEQSAPHISITLAAPAPLSLKRSLTAWCRQNVQPDVLVNFRFNSTILGGMVVSWGSHTFDWSFRRQILANLQKFPEVLKSV